MEIHGWGRYPRIEASVTEPVDSQSIASYLAAPRNIQNTIVRGAGRSYGDSALSEHIISSRYLDSFKKFDQQSGEFSCAAGITLDQILNLCIPKGWFLPVLPGTRFVSIGGAIASDIHGKNHHLDGCFSEFVKSIDLMLASGEIVKCSSARNKTLFRATCGGMGLTGVILGATLQLVPLGSTFIRQKSLVAKNLDEVFGLFEENAQSKYSVAWLDCTAKGAKLGRSLLYLGEHEDDDCRHLRNGISLSAPLYSPGFILNKHTMSTFNSAYYQLSKRKKRSSRIHYTSYFFPLDRIHHWNRLYGGKGFLQYQFVIPTEAAREGITAVLEETINKGKGSFLTVLKKMGAGNQNFLSFPVEGYTLTLDFKYENSLLPMLDRLDEIVLAHNGRHYLAKDARMSEQTFKKSYPAWEKLVKVREKVDPENLFASAQSTRLGLVSS